MPRLVHFGALLCLTLLTLSGCGRMRAAEWPSSALTGGSSGGGGSTPRTANYRSLQSVDGRTCAISNSGALFCWGDNTSGQVTPPPEWTVGANEVLALGGGPMEALQGPPAGVWIPHIAEEKKKILSLATQSELSHLCAVIGNEASPGVFSGDVHCFGTPTLSTLFGSSVGANGRIKSGDRFKSVKTSEKLVCARTENDQLHCIGDSPAFVSPDLDQIGLPSIGPFSTAVTDYAVGTNHVCVILNDQGIYCWGANDQLQLGVASPGAYTLGDFSNGAVSKVVLTGFGNLSTFTRVFASDNQTCAIGTDAAAYCWGRGIPPQRVSLAGWSVRTLSMGTGHNCLVYDTTIPLLTGRVACAGTNTNGQLGRGTISAYELVVTNVVIDQFPTYPELTDIREVIVGQTFTCAVASTGSLWCWGRNSTTFKEIDMATVADFTRAAAPRSNADVELVAAGNDFHCSSRIDGTLTCSGANIFKDAQESGVTSLPEFLDSTLVMGPYFFGESPGPLPGAPLVNPMASNNVMSCVSSQAGNGELACWGQFYDPQNPSTPTVQLHPSPAPIPGLSSEVSSVALGLAHACAVRKGALYCWGSNFLGQVNGDTNVSAYAEPQMIFQTGVTAVTAGAYHTCAIVKGDVVCWGGNQYGQLGAGRESNMIPYPVRALKGSSSTVHALAAGQLHTCAVIGTPARVTCWGYNLKGQLGSGAVGGLSSTPGTPFSVDPAYDPVSIVSGYDHTCVKALSTTLTEYRLFCWGGNNAGELGLNPVSDPQIPTPTLMSNEILSDTNPIAAQGDLTCFTVKAGPMEKILCMGDNTNAAIGKGFPQVNARTNYSPEELISFNLLGNSIHLAPGSSHLCYSVGGTFCIGSNAYAQLGNGKKYGMKVATPTRVFASDVLEVALGANHTCAILSGGNLHCWGMNLSGTNRLLPFVSTQEFSVDVNEITATGVEHVAAFGTTTCISKANKVSCWGANNGGILGVDPGMTPWMSYDDALVAPPILSGNIRGLFMSETKACALDDLTLKCWGNNSNESLAPGAGLITTPVTVATNVEHAVVAEWGVCFAGTGALGCVVSPWVADANNLSADISIENVESIQDLSVNPWLPTLCATTTDGKLYCGGDNNSGLLNSFGGTGTNLTFGLLDSDTHKFSMSQNHLCGDSSSTVSCSGSDLVGEIGNGDEDFMAQSILTPVEFP